MYSYTFSYTFGGVKCHYSYPNKPRNPVNIHSFDTQPKQQIPMIQPQEQISMVEPHTTTFAEPIMKEVCTRIDGCRVIDNVCIDCEFGLTSF